MKRLLVLGLAFIFVFAIAVTGQAAVITFDELLMGSVHSSLVYTDVTFSNNLGNLTVSASPGSPLSMNTIIGPNSHNPAEWNIARFTPGLNVRNVSVDMGDYNADNDTLVLQAYNSANVLIGSDTQLNPGSVYGGLTLSVSTLQPIAYVLFDEKGNNDQLTGYPGSAFFDNFKYTAVPEPGTLLLLGFGLSGLALIRKKFQV